MKSFAKFTISLTLSLAAATASHLALASGSAAPDFLLSVSGHYELVDATSYTCRQLAQQLEVDYSAAQAQLTLKFAAGVRPAYQDIFNRVNRSAIRSGDDMFTYRDEKSVASGGTVKKLDRSCGGVILVTCGAWNNLEELSFKDDTLTLVKRNDSETDCTYHKTP